MPIYEYRDPQTGFTKDVMHPMSELDNPSPATLAEITHEGRRMVLGITAPYIATFGSLSALGKKGRLKAKTPEQVEKMKQRSRDHARREGIQDQKHEVNKSLIAQGRELLGR